LDKGFYVFCIAKLLSKTYLKKKDKKKTQIEAEL